MLAIYGATQGPQHGWASRAAWPYLGSGVVLLAGYVPWALRRPHPAVDLTLLRHAQTALAVGLCALVAVVMFAVLFLLPVFLEELQASLQDRAQAVVQQDGPPRTRPSSIP